MGCMGNRAQSTNREFNVLCLHKGTEHYLFLYDDASLPETLNAFRCHAADKDLSFNYFDAAVMGDKARYQANIDSNGLPKKK